MSAIDRLTESFMRFPGIGPKQAKRFVYFLLRQSPRFKQDLILAIDELTDTSSTCEKCLRLYAKEKTQTINSCAICSDSQRDISKLLLVEKELDLEAIEKTGAYQGRYFIIGGIIPFHAEKPSEHIHIRELVTRIHDSIEVGELKEVIFALSVTDEADYTKEYIEKTLRQIVGIKDVTFSVLARGLSSGLELEYVDKDTFKSAFDQRVDEVE